MAFTCNAVLGIPRRELMSVPPGHLNQVQWSCSTDGRSRPSTSGRRDPHSVWPGLPEHIEVMVLGLLEHREVGQPAQWIGLGVR
jgi:hypothetical protein